MEISVSLCVIPAVKMGCAFVQMNVSVMQGIVACDVTQVVRPESMARIVPIFALAKTALPVMEKLAPAPVRQDTMGRYVSIRVLVTRMGISA